MAASLTGSVELVHAWVHRYECCDGIFIFIYLFLQFVIENVCIIFSCFS